MKLFNNKIKGAPANVNAHGGELTRGRRKAARPFDPSKSIHLVMRASRAKGALSLLAGNRRSTIEKLVWKRAENYGVTIERFVNVGNHLHIMLKTKSSRYWPAKLAFQRFLKRIAGEIAFKIAGGRRGKAFGRFWDHLAYTRLVSWGRERANMLGYFALNIFEAAGMLNRSMEPGARAVVISSG